MYDAAYIQGQNQLPKLIFESLTNHWEDDNLSSYSCFIIVESISYISSVKG